MASTALKVCIDIDQKPPCVRLKFVDPGYQQGTGPVEIALPSDQVFSIRIYSSDHFGINFKDPEDARNWHGTVVPREWPHFKALFTHESGKSSTVWIRRSFNKARLEKLGLSYVAELEDDIVSEGSHVEAADVNVKSEESPMEKVTQVISKIANRSSLKKQSDQRKKQSDQRKKQSDKRKKQSDQRKNQSD